MSCVEIVWLKKRRDYLRTQSGRKCRRPSFTLAARARRDAVSAEKDISRFGFTVTKRVGNAVQRNRVKRRLREAIRMAGPKDARAGYDYVVIARDAVLDAPFGEIVEELQKAMQRVHAGS